MLRFIKGRRGFGGFWEEIRVFLGGYWGRLKVIIGFRIRRFGVWVYLV